MKYKLIKETPDKLTGFMELFPKDKDGVKIYSLGNGYPLAFFGDYVIATACRYNDGCNNIRCKISDAYQIGFHRIDASGRDFLYEGVESEDEQ